MLEWAEPQPTQRAQGYRGSMLPDVNAPEEVRRSDNAMVKATDSPLVKNILTILATNGVPLTAISIARKCGLERAADVNPALYALLKESRLVKKEDGKPAWSAKVVTLETHRWNGNVRACFPAAGMLPCSGPPLNGYRVMH